MEEKVQKKVKLSTLLLLFIIFLLIILLGVVYYLGFVKDNNTIENKLGNNSNTFVETNGISNSNKNSENELINKNNKNSINLINNSISNIPTANNSIDNMTTTNTSSEPKEKIIGDWKVTKILDEYGNELEITEVFGRGILENNKLTISPDMKFINGVGITGEGNEKGTYTIEGNEITLTDLQQRVRTLTYNKADDTLNEIYNGINIRNITYVRISNEEKIIQQTTELKIKGAWQAIKVTDTNGNNVDLNIILYNDLLLGSGHISFTTDYGTNECGYDIGPQERSSSLYSVHKNVVKVWSNIPRFYYYDEKDDILKETVNFEEKSYDVTYIRY